MATPDDTTLNDLPPVEPDPGRNQSDIRDLRREATLTRAELRDLRAAYRACESELASLRDRYSLVAGMTPAQRVGAVTGVGAALAVLLQHLPQILAALGAGSP